MTFPIWWEIIKFHGSKPPTSFYIFLWCMVSLNIYFLDQGWDGDSVPPIRIGIWIHQPKMSMRPSKSRSGRPQQDIQKIDLWKIWIEKSGLPAMAVSMFRNPLCFKGCVDDFYGDFYVKKTKVECVLNIMMISKCFKTVHVGNYVLHESLFVSCFHWGFGALPKGAPQSIGAPSLGKCFVAPFFCSLFGSPFLI